MFATRSKSHEPAVQRATEDAWDRLVSAAESTRDAARAVQRRTSDMADGAGSSVASATGEARRRAGEALDALAGRRRRTRWEWVAGAAVLGLIVGWVAAAGARRAAAEIEAPTLAEDEDPLDAVADQRF